MKIKYPCSNNALRDLSKLIEDFRVRIYECNKSKHHFISILYISSYIMSRSPLLFNNSVSILDHIGSIVSNNLPNVICVVRTVPPRHFPINMRYVQRNAVSKLRSHFCHVNLFHKNLGLNHAKFVLAFHFCFYEKRVYHGRFYGSANLTSRGLCGRSNGWGNYEEYYYSRFRYMRLNRYDLRYYIEDIKNLMCRKINSYTDRGYLLKFCLDQLSLLENVYKNLSARIAGTSIVEYYVTYIEALSYLWYLISLLEDLPGFLFIEEKLNTIEEELRKIETMFELDALFLDIKREEVPEKRIYELLEILNWDKKLLAQNAKIRVKLLGKLLKILDDYCNFIKKEKLEKYMSDSEKSYLKHAFEYGESQKLSLDKIIAYFLS